MLFIIRMVRIESAVCQNIKSEGHFSSPSFLVLC